MSPRMKRQEKIAQVLRSSRLESQEALLKRLQQAGVRTTQSTLSRDLATLGAYKADGVYHLPGADGGDVILVELRGLDTAGDHMIVLRTPPGQASLAALQIDQAGMADVVGTVAGDDTIFVAVKGQLEQRRAVRAILNLFRP